MLPAPFYQRTDVVAIARDLLGCMVHTVSGGFHTSGRIVETEAYAGPDDRASHARGGLRTPRNEAMYAAGGCAYVYLCYGLHSMINIVTGPENLPHAVLIRAIEPVDGVAQQLARRGLLTVKPALSNGPGKVAQALGIDRRFNAKPLTGPDIWLEDSGWTRRPDVVSGPRIGVDYAGPDALLPYRFRIKDHPFAGR